MDRVDRLPGQKSGTFCGECGRAMVLFQHRSSLMAACPVRNGWRLFLTRDPWRHDLDVVELDWQWPRGKNYDKQTGAPLQTRCDFIRSDVSGPSSNA